MKQEDTEKMRSLYWQWLATGQSITSFAKAHGYKVSTFSYWIKKFQAPTDVPSKKESGFSKLAFDTPVCSNQPLMVITYPFGTKIALYSPVSASYLKELAG